MSFLMEIISAASKTEISTILEKTPELVLLIEDTKKELVNYLDNVFVKYSQPARQGTNFREKINSATVTLSRLEACVNEVTKQDIGNVQSEIVSYDKKLSEAREEMKLLGCLIGVHESIINANDALGEEKFSETIELIRLANKNVELLRFDEPLIVLEHIQGKLDGLEKQLLTAMNCKLHQYIDYSCSDNKAYIKIKDSNTLQELFLAYVKWDDHVMVLNDIAKFLWDHIFWPIVNFKVTAKVTLIEDAYRLDIEILDEANKDGYKEVFENISSVIDYFVEHLKFSLENCTTLEYMGSDLRDNLSELLVKSCLNDTIPNNTEQLQNYSAVIADVESLQAKLMYSGFFSEDMNSLLEYAKKVDEHYIRKKCQAYLKIAEDIMKKDLHNMIEVGEPIDLSNPFRINQDVFYQRSVSKSCLELLDLTEDVLKQITGTPGMSGKLLYHTTQTICAEYGDKVSEYHQKLLQTIPQQVALFLNNCTYLSHKLVSWEEEYGKEIKAALNMEESLFSSEVQRLNIIGNKAFNEFIEQQIKQMEQIMKESGLMSVITLEELEPITEKCIRQCLRQQELLRTVWHKVLSYSDYNQNLGITLNFLCKSIIDAVLQFRDISSKAGDQLVDVLKVIFTRGPKLFTDQKDVFVYVGHWHKLNELSFLLSSNLLEIADRWADGKGPLSLQFKPDELKRLIKALFQNTDRRAAVLAKIK